MFATIQSINLLKWIWGTFIHVVICSSYSWLVSTMKFAALWRNSAHALNADLESDGWKQVLYKSAQTEKGRGKLRLFCNLSSIKHWDKTVVECSKNTCSERSTGKQVHDQGSSICQACLQVTTFRSHLCAARRFSSFADRVFPICGKTIAKAVFLQDWRAALSSCGTDCKPERDDGMWE